MDRDPPLAEDHQALRELLPWYVSGQLDMQERARVADHLAECVECRSELQAERSTAKQIAKTPIDVDLGWAAMRRRIEGERPARRRWSLVGVRPRFALMIAAQVLLLIVAVVVVPRRSPPAAYHVLAATPVAAKGDALVMFAPDTSTAYAGTLLVRAKARIVDGPTAGGAFVLAVPTAERSAALARLRGDRAVTLAEPIDP